MRSSALALGCLLAACAQPEPGHPVAGPVHPPPVQYPTQTFPRPQPRPLQDANQQLSAVEQILRQLQSIRGTVNRF